MTITLHLWQLALGIFGGDVLSVAVILLALHRRGLLHVVITRPASDE